MKISFCINHLAATNTLEILYSPFQTHISKKIPTKINIFFGQKLHVHMCFEEVNRVKNTWASRFYKEAFQDNI